MRVLQVVIGILFAPFFWFHNRLIKRSPSVPPEFWLFIKSLNARGVTAQIQMQKLPLPMVSKSAIVVLEPNTQVSRVVSLLKLDTVETARQKLSELESNPLMSHSKQRDRYLMSVTFSEPNGDLAAKVSAAFDEFQLPPNQPLQPTPQSDAAER